MSDTTPMTREQVADALDAAADELDRAAKHLRTAAGHFRDHEVPRGCAHAWAGHGHILTAQRLMGDTAVSHAAHSEP